MYMRLGSTLPKLCINEEDRTNLTQGAIMKASSIDFIATVFSSVAQSCLILCNPMDCNPPGSSAHGDSPRQEYWSGILFPLPGDLPNPGIEPRSPASQADSLPSELPGKPPNEDIINGLKIIALVFRWSPSFFKTEYFMGRNDNLFICVPNSRTGSRIQEISKI